MILLDTNVLSEPLQSKPSKKVVEWLDSQAAETLYLSAISYAELRFGVLRLPHGKRKNELGIKVDQALNLFKDRTLAFDIEAAEHLAQILTRTEKIGRKTPAPDAYIAAIAMARGFAVATRNVDHFQETGISIINPWK
jgi:toxin FitB